VTRVSLGLGSWEYRLEYNVLVEETKTGLD
jgi:hypothetical protein